MRTSANLTRRCFLKDTCGAAALLMAGRSAAAETGHNPSDQEVLQRCAARIDKNRKGDATVVVRKPNGTPVPGATVRIEQLRHEFLFGCNFFMFDRCRNPDHEQQYRQRFSDLLNYATLGFYWGAYEPQAGKPNYEYTDKAVSWCRERNITCKGHPLAWDHPASSPRWLPSDTTQIERLSTARVRDIVARFKGRIDIWDVVNEPTDLTRFKNPMNDWAKHLGAVPFTRRHLAVAREANPQARLLVNDYRTDRAFYDILDNLRSDGKMPFDMIGIQSHMHGGGWPLHKVWSVCDTFSDFRVPIHFTETTVVSGPRKGPGENWGVTTPESEQTQSDYAEKFYTALFAHPAVEALTWWDFSDQGAWQGAPAGWLRKDMSPKPVYDRLHSLIKGKWWTKLEGATDSTGQFAARAFYGAHRVTAGVPGGPTVSKDVLWQRGKRNVIELTVG